METRSVEQDTWVDVCASSEVSEGSFKLVRGGKTPVALHRLDGRVHAIDNRCPHMGFPLSKGQVHEGIVVCPWHHWKFDLATGGCLSAGEYDVTAYEVREQNGRVLLGPPMGDGADRLFERYEGELREGFKSGDPFQIAKAVTRFLRAGGQERRLVRFAAELALSLDGGGPGGTWGGLTSLANAHEMARRLDGDDRILGFVQAMQELSRVIARASPRRPVRPLQPLQRNDPERLARLLRYFADKRTAVGVERCLATLTALKLPERQFARGLFDTLGGHLYPSAGHVHDFVYRCFDLLDRVGWDLAPTAFGTLAPLVSGASWSEESEPWAPYVDRLFDIRRRLQEGTLAPGEQNIDQNGLGRRLAEAERHDVLDALEEALAAGARATDLSGALNLGWARRLAGFALVNQTDWAQVFHGVIAADSIDQALRRFGPSAGLLAAVFDSAVALYLTQSLNIPRVRLPQRDRPGDLPVDDPDGLLKELADCLELRQPDRAGACVAHYLWQGFDEDKLVSTMIAAMFRENGDFHTFQTMRATINQFVIRPGDPDRHLFLVGIARMFAAQRMLREVLMSTQFALKLSRGEYLAGGDE